MCYNQIMETIVLQFFEGLRTDALTYLFGFFSFLGEGLTVGAVVLLIYWLVGGRTGEQLLCTVLSSAAINALLKETVHRPRPYAAGVVSRLDVDNFLFSTRGLGDTLSFPSGHAMSSTAAWTAMRAKRWWAWIVAILVLLTICASRMYFGVHYPTDLLAGAAFGLLIALFWELVFSQLYAYRHFFLMGIALVCLFALPAAPSSDFVHMTALLAGAAFFLPLTAMLRYDVPKKFVRRLWRLPVGLVCVGIVFAATYFLPEGAGWSLLKWFLLVGAGTFLSAVFFKLLKI